jgi:hypothetical protein
MLIVEIEFIKEESCVPAILNEPIPFAAKYKSFNK